MGKYAFVVAASENYTDILKALVASIHYHQPEADLILILYKFDFYDPKAIIIRSDEANECQVRSTAIERFKYCVEYAEKYDAICMLDADMFLVNDCTLFFDIASKGFIVTGSNGMLINFNEAYHKQYDWPYEKDVIYPKLHTSVPIFINKENTDWFEKLYNKKTFDYWDDFTYLNFLGYYMGKDKKMLCLPPYYFTGIHHFQMKPECGVMEKGGYTLGGTEELIYMVHGKWHWEGWLQDLQPAMDNFIKNEDIGERGRQKIKNSMDLLKRLYRKYYNMYQIEILKEENSPIEEKILKEETQSGRTELELMREEIKLLNVRIDDLVKGGK